MEFQLFDLEGYRVEVLSRIDGVCGLNRCYPNKAIADAMVKDLKNGGNRHAFAHGILVLTKDGKTGTSWRRASSFRNKFHRKDRQPGQTSKYAWPSLFLVMFAK